MSKQRPIFEPRKKKNPQGVFALSLAFIDQIDAPSGQRTGNQVFHVEGLTQAKAGLERTNHGNQGVIDGHLADRVATQQLIIERESRRGYANQQN